MSIHVQAPQLEKKYPMWVMRITDFLSLTKLPSHLELKSSGILHMHEAHFFTIFVSHQLLDRSGPTGIARSLPVFLDVFGSFWMCLDVFGCCWMFFAALDIWYDVYMYPCI